MDDREFIEDDVSMLDYLLPLVRWRWLIFWSCLVFAIVGIVVALLRDPTYTATAYFIPRGALGSDAEYLSVGTAGRNWRDVARASDMVQYYSVSLKSLPLMQRMLKREFQSRSKEKKPLLTLLGFQDVSGDGRRVPRRAMMKLRSGIKVASAGGKILSLSMTANAPELAAGMANALLEEYDRLPQGEEEASSELAFIKERLEDVRAKLDQKEKQIAKAKARSLDIGQPDAVLEVSALEREARLLEGLFQTLNAEYARAEIRMLKRQQDDIGQIEVLEKAEPPMLRSGPKRKKVTLGFILFGFVVSVGFAYVREYFRVMHERFGSHPFWGAWQCSRRDLCGMFVIAVLAAILAAGFLFIF